MVSKIKMFLLLCILGKLGDRYKLSYKEEFTFLQLQVTNCICYTLYTITLQYRYLLGYGCDIC